MGMLNEKMAESWMSCLLSCEKDKPKDRLMALRKFRKRNVPTFRFEVVVYVIISGVSRRKGEGQLKRNVKLQNAVTFSTPKKRTIFRQLLRVFLHTNSFICWPFYALLDSSTLSQSFSAENVFIGGRQLL